MTDLIHLDQVSFVPSREARDNTTKVLNLIHRASVTKTSCVFLSTDAEKAFDRVSWEFMSSALRHIGLGNKMVQWISNIYSIPTAQVKANGVLSEPLTISNGTRQGCPLSSPIFALVLEPFLCTIRQNSDITGITIDQGQY